MDDDFFDEGGSDGTDDDCRDMDLEDEAWLDEDLEEEWDADSLPEEAFDAEREDDLARDDSGRSGQTSSGYDEMDALVLGTMIAGTANDDARRTRRGQRGPNRT